MFFVAKVGAILIRMMMSQFDQTAAVQFLIQGYAFLKTVRRKKRIVTRF